MILIKFYYLWLFPNYKGNSQILLNSYVFQFLIDISDWTQTLMDIVSEFDEHNPGIAWKQGNFEFYHQNLILFRHYKILKNCWKCQITNCISYSKLMTKRYPIFINKLLESPNSSEMRIDHNLCQGDYLCGSIPSIATMDQDRYSLLYHKFYTNYQHH